MKVLGIKNKVDALMENEQIELASESFRVGLS